MSVSPLGVLFAAGLGVWPAHLPGPARAAAVQDLGCPVTPTEDLLPTVIAPLAGDAPGTEVAGSKTRRRGVSFERVREIALDLPGVEEGTSYGTPAFRVRGKFLARLREDGETLVIRIDFDEREILMAADPETFFITDHYRDYPAVLARLSTVDADQLGESLLQAWRQQAPKRLVAEHDAER